MSETRFSYLCREEGGEMSFVVRKKDMKKSSHLRMFETRDEAYRWVIGEAENTVIAITENLEMARNYLDYTKCLYTQGETHA